MQWRCSFFDCLFPSTSFLVLTLRQAHFQGRDYIHSRCYHSNHPIVACGSCARLWCHSKVFPRFLPQLFYRTATKSAAIVWNNGILRSADQGKLPGMLHLVPTSAYCVFLLQGFLISLCLACRIVWHDFLRPLYSSLWAKHEVHTRLFLAQEVPQRTVQTTRAHRVSEIDRNVVLFPISALQLSC